MKIQKTNLKASSFLHMIAAASITVCMFTSCNGGLTEQSESDPAGTYRNYLLEVRKMKSISFEELSENLCQWQAIRDSVFNHVRQASSSSAFEMAVVTPKQNPESLSISM